MKQPLSEMFARQRDIEARKPKPHARGEGIRAVKAWVGMQARFFDYAISDALADEIASDWQAAMEFDPMLLGFPNDGGLE